MKPFCLTPIACLLALASCGNPEAEEAKAPPEAAIDQLPGSRGEGKASGGVSMSGEANEKAKVRPSVGNPSAVQTPQQLAQQWTAEAFAALSGRLMEAIKTDGHPAAIHVCAMEAGDLLDGVAEAHGASIRRVTDRPRNPANRADARDLEVMEMIRAMIADGDTPKPVADENVVRMPIRVAMPLCLTCHGDPQRDIAPETLAAIRKRYPDDMATGYREGDLRGLWRVEMPNPPSP